MPLLEIIQTNVVGEAVVEGVAKRGTYRATRRKTASPFLRCRQMLVTMVSVVGVQGCGGIIFHYHCKCHRANQLGNNNNLQG